MTRCHWKNVFLVFPERRGLAPQAGLHASTRVVRGQKQQEGGSLGQSLYWAFFRKGRAGRANSLGLTRANNPSGLWEIDPGMI